MLIDSSTSLRMTAGGEAGDSVGMLRAGADRSFDFAQDDARERQSQMGFLEL